MKVLIPSSRMPFALGMLRKLAAEGARSTPPTITCCRRETTRSTWRGIASPFSTLARLHDKGAFERLVRKLGLPIPGTVLVTSDDELRDAADRLEK